MSFDLPNEINPFEAPRAGIGEDALYLDLAPDDNAELIRREHLGREANIRSLGRMNYLGGCVTAFFSILIGLMAVGVIPLPPDKPRGLDPSLFRLFMGAGALLYLFATAVLVGIGYGLVRLQVWARWATVVLTSLALLYIALMTLLSSYLINPVVGIVIGVVGGGISSLIIYLLTSGKAGMVFSREYKEIIRKTPHIRNQTSIIVKILLVILAAVIAMGVLATIFGGNR